MILPFNELVEKEVLSARQKHSPINSVHEGYSVILEELDEFWDEVKKKRSQRDSQHMLEELVQIAAMAQRCAEDVVIPSINNTVQGGKTLAEVFSEEKRPMVRGKGW